MPPPPLTSLSRRARALLGPTLAQSPSLVVVAALTLGLGLIAVVQLYLGYHATEQWRANAKMVMERRTNEVASLLNIALVRDMRGAYQYVSALDPAELASGEDFALSGDIAEAFSRFSYVEGFFVSRPDRVGAPVLFIRSDKPPGWLKVDEQAPFPVSISRSPTAAHLVALARAQMARSDRYAFFDTAIEGSHYQVFARLFRDGSARPDGQAAIVGALVNLDLVRDQYFREFAEQMEGMLGRQGSEAVSMSIVDANGKVVTRTRPESATGPYQERKFSLAFFDSTDVPVSALHHVTMAVWTARVSAANDPLLGAADAAASRTRLLIVSSGAVAVVALILVFRSMRMNLEIMTKRSDFLAMVSHELKTPLAGITLAAEALSKGLYKSDQAVTEYGALALRESMRLRTLVDNLLNASRSTHMNVPYLMGDVDIMEALDEALLRLHTQIQEKHVRIARHLDDDLPPVRADREALVQVFLNLLDNAIKYSSPSAQIEVTAGQSAHAIHVSIKDAGRGVPADDLPRVFDMFFRGKNAGLNGTGLGLTIVKKIITDHGGRIDVQSTPDVGTCVSVTLPLVQGEAA